MNDEAVSENKSSIDNRARTLAEFAPYLLLVLMFSLTVWMVFTWFFNSYQSPLRQVDAISLATAVINTAAVVIGVVPITVGITTFLIARDYDRKVREVENEFEGKLQSYATKMNALAENLAKMEKAHDGFQSPKDILSVVDRKDESLEQRIQNMLRTTYTPAGELKNDILTAVERDVYRTLVAAGLTKSSFRGRSRL